MPEAKKDPRTPDDRKRWDRAEEIFKEQKGHKPKGDEYALVQHIFQGMKRTNHVPKGASVLRRQVIRLAASKPASDPLRAALLAALRS